MKAKLIIFGIVMMVLILSLSISDPSLTKSDQDDTEVVCGTGSQPGDQLSEPESPDDDLCDDIRGRDNSELPKDNTANKTS